MPSLDTFKRKVEFIPLKVDFLSLKVEFLSLKVEIICVKVEFFPLKVDFISLKVDFISLKVETISLKVDFLPLKVEISFVNFDIFPRRQHICLGTSTKVNRYLESVLGELAFHPLDLFSINIMAWLGLAQNLFVLSKVLLLLAP